MSTPKPPPGFVLDEPTEAPPPPPGFRLDQVTSEPQTAQHNYLPKGGAGWFEPESISGTMLRGFGQGESFGFSDELNGGVTGLTAGFSRIATQFGKTPPGRAAMRAYLGKPDLPDVAVDMLIEQGAQQAAGTVLGMKNLPLNADDALSSGYRSGRDTARLENVQSRSANPGTFMASEIAGSVASPVLPPVGKGPMTLAKAGTIAKGGAMMGGAAALGQSRADLTRYENDPQQIMDSVGDVAMGTTGGALLAPAMAVGGDKVGNALRTGSQNSALKAIGLRAGISSQLEKRGYETADDARQLAQRAMDLGLIKPFGKAADVAERGGFAKDIAGARIEGALADADAAALRPGAGFDADRGSWQAASAVMGHEGLSPTAIREGTRARRLVEDISKLPTVQDSTFKNANKLKSDMYDGIDYGTSPALRTRMERKAAGGLRQSIEDQIAETAGPEVADQLRMGNKDWGDLSDITGLAKEESRRQLERKSMTALDWASVLGAGAAGHSVGGAGTAGAAAALTAGAKLLGPRIPSAMAMGQRALAPKAVDLFTAGAKAAIQPPLRPSLKEEEEDAIQAFLTGG